MKWRNWFERLRCRDRIVARFGNAVLTKDPAGHWRLEGGTHSDRLAAREWISLFLHEAVCGTDGPRRIATGPVPHGALPTRHSFTSAAA